VTVRVALAVALLAFAPACTRSRITLGSPVVPEEAASIGVGASKAEVLSRLGPPDRVEIETGGSAFEYLYSRASGRTLDVSLFRASFTYDEARRLVDRLRVSFDRDGVVRYVGVLPAETPRERR
jgi:outer membrane protein assembly factor BamE (lipoprotein component of BamABCDE complex)